MADTAGRRDDAAPIEDIIIPGLLNPSPFKCEICGITSTCFKSLEVHKLGKKHAKNLLEAKLKAKNRKCDEKAESDSDDSDTSEEMRCELCDKTFSGYVSYVAHIKGQGHAKNVKKQKLRKQLDDRPEVIKHVKNESDSEDDGILPKPYARCSTCQKEFSGPESFKAHVNSATHLKKLKQALELVNLKKEEGEHSDDEERYSKCDICKKCFSGVIPFKIHMQSNLHKKNIEKKKVAEEIKEFCANTEFEDRYVCKECNKTFTDPLALKCHLKNNSHEKKKAKKALSEFLKSFPEIVYVTPDDKGALEEERDDDESIDYLICTLCHFSFSGPESAQDHVKSKKHINHKKEKMMQKLLKGQKKVTPPKADSENQMPKQASSDGSDQTNNLRSELTNLEEYEIVEKITQI